MKKILSLILTLIIALSLAACADKKTEEVSGNEANQEITVGDDIQEKDDEEEVIETVEDDKVESEKEEAEKPEVKPETKPEVKPETKPEAKPETKPEEKPETNNKKSVASTLLAQFKSVAGNGNALSIADKLAANSVFGEMSMGTMSVEPGFLTGFQNSEIKGFSEGAMFSPIIGTIPFVGYVFTLESTTDASAFISTLKKSANLNWNICTTADEMVSGSSGNKVFFVMSPETFDEE